MSRRCSIRRALLLPCCVKRRVKWLYCDVCNGSGTMLGWNRHSRSARIVSQGSEMKGVSGSLSDSGRHLVRHVLGCFEYRVSAGRLVDAVEV
jgi:hypothetical protein